MRVPGTACLEEMPSATILSRNRCASQGLSRSHIIRRLFETSCWRSSCMLALEKDAVVAANRASGRRAHAVCRGCLRRVGGGPRTDLGGRCPACGDRCVVRLARDARARSPREPVARVSDRRLHRGGQGVLARRGARNRDGRDPRCRSAGADWTGPLAADGRRYGRRSPDHATSRSVGPGAAGR